LAIITWWSQALYTHQQQFQGCSPMGLTVSQQTRPPASQTGSDKPKRLWKRQAVWLQNATKPMSTARTTPCIRTRAQVATAGARVAPPSMSTHSRAQQSSVLTPSHRQVLFVAAVIRQLRHQRGMVCLTHAASQDWKMKSIKLWQSWMRTQASSLTTDSWWEAQSTEKHGASRLPTNLDNWQTASKGVDKEPYQHYQIHTPTRGTSIADERYHIQTIWLHGEIRNGRTQSMINYSGAVATPSAEMLVAKMLFISLISTIQPSWRPTTTWWVKDRGTYHGWLNWRLNWDNIILKLVGEKSEQMTDDSTVPLARHVSRLCYVFF
jgi:hypothetical protein